MRIFDQARRATVADDDEGRAHLAHLTGLLAASVVPEGDATGFRARALGLLATEAQAYLAPPAVWFDAMPMTQEDAPGGLRLVAARVRTSGGAAEAQRPKHLDIRLRCDQICAARLWGVGLRFSDARGRALAATLLSQVATGALLDGLESLAGIEEKSDGRPVRISGDPHATAFERLVLDLLNEERAAARRATLSEDLFEKTDLRLGVPGIDQRARVQVSAIAERKLHERKLAKIARPEELVILTPRSLAVALDGPGAKDLLPPDEVASLRQACGGAGHDRVEHMAYELRGVLQRALTRSAQHPLGPLAAVPPALRRFVRRFADRAARCAHDARNERLARPEALRRCA